MKILFFTQYFWPENFRINELVSFFSKKKSNKSIVLTGYPSYPKKKLFKYENYEKNPVTLKNAEIIRFQVLRRDDSNLSIILNYFTFFLSSFFFGIIKILKKKFDIIFVFCPSPILNAIPAIFIKKIFKKKIIIWVLDLWPNTLVDLKIIKNKKIQKFLEVVVKYIYDNCDLILAQSQSIKKEIEKKTKVKCLYFPSWPEEIGNDKRVIKDIRQIKKNKIKILFAGNIGEAQSFETLIKCAKSLKNLDIVQWIIIGEGRWKKNLIKLIKINKLEKDVQLLKSVPLIRIKNYYNSVDALYLSLKNNKTFNKTIPGKLQTYMSSNKPIIASISGETSKIISKSKCGFVSKAEDHKSLKENIIRFYKLKKKDRQKLANNGKKFCEKHFSKTLILNRLKKNINSILT